MKQVSTIGLDIAKKVFHVHGADAAGKVVLRRQLRRSEVLKFFAKLPPCLVGMEACATAHYWAREIAALGHDVRLMPPQRSKAYVKPGAKNDAADAAGCCEGVSRPSMTFVPIKSVDQQAALMQHRVRKLLDKQAKKLRNAMRSHLAEFGIVAAKGDRGFAALLAVVERDLDPRLPALASPTLVALAAQLRAANEQIERLDQQIIAWHKTNPDSQRLDAVPQFGPIVSSALVVTAGDAKRFANGRQFAAWLGLVPRQHTTGGKPKLGAITKTGDKYVRHLLVLAATGMIRRVKAKPELSPWLADLLARKPPKQAAVALANKFARIAWVILAKGETYRAQPGVAATA